MVFLDQTMILTSYTLYTHYYFRPVGTPTPGLNSHPAHLDTTPELWGYCGKGPHGVGSIPDHWMSFEEKTIQTLYTFNTYCSPVLTIEWRRSHDLTNLGFLPNSQESLHDLPRGHIMNISLHGGHLSKYPCWVQIRNAPGVLAVNGLFFKWNFLKFTWCPPRTM